MDVDNDKQIESRWCCSETLVESKTHFHLGGVNELSGLANNKIFFEALVSFDVNEVSFKRI